MGTHHFTAGYSNPVFIISAISHRIRLQFFSPLFPFRCFKILYLLIFFFFLSPAWDESVFGLQSAQVHKLMSKIVAKVIYFTIYYVSLCCYMVDFKLKSLDSKFRDVNIKGKTGGGGGGAGGVCTVVWCLSLNVWMHRRYHTQSQPVSERARPFPWMPRPECSVDARPPADANGKIRALCEKCIMGKEQKFSTCIVTVVFQEDMHVVISLFSNTCGLLCINWCVCSLFSLALFSNY